MTNSVKISFIHVSPYLKTFISGPFPRKPGPDWILCKDPTISPGVEPVPWNCKGRIGNQCVYGQCSPASMERLLFSNEATFREKHVDVGTPEVGCGLGGVGGGGGGGV